MPKNERKDELSHEEWESLRVEMWNARAGHDSPLELVYRWEQTFTPRLLLRVFAEAVGYSG